MCLLCLYEVFFLVLGGGDARDDKGGCSICIFPT